MTALAVILWFLGGMELYTNDEFFDCPRWEALIAAVLWPIIALVIVCMVGWEWLREPR